MKICIGSDHAGYDYKKYLSKKLEAQGHQLIDYGTDSADSADYPDFAHPVAKEVGENTKIRFGVLICGSANGVAMTANKHPKVRAAICWNIEIAELARLHNNANIICIPARFVGKVKAAEMLDVFLKTKFEGGRHKRRVNKISC